MIPDSRTRRRIAARFRRPGDRIYIHGKLATDPVYAATAHAIAGRRLPVSVQSWRERTLAEADVAARSHAGTLEVTASLPGLVVAIAVATGSEVAAGEPLLTIEAMKMQNEVRAPRDGVVGEILVAAGVAVATGQLLLRLD